MFSFGCLKFDSLRLQVVIIGLQSVDLILERLNFSGINTVVLNHDSQVQLIFNVITLTLLKSWVLRSCHLRLSSSNRVS